MDDRESRFNVSTMVAWKKSESKWQKETLLSWENTWVCREELTVLRARVQNESTPPFWKKVCALKVTANQTNVGEKRKPLYRKEKLGCLQVSVLHTKAGGGKIQASGLWREINSDLQTSSYQWTLGVGVPEVREPVQPSMVTDYRETPRAKLQVWWDLRLRTQVRECVTGLLSSADSTC